MGKRKRDPEAAVPAPKRKKLERKNTKEYCGDTPNVPKKTSKLFRRRSSILAPKDGTEDTGHVDLVRVVGPIDEINCHDSPLLRLPLDILFKIFMAMGRERKIMGQTGRKAYYIYQEIFGDEFKLNFEPSSLIFPPNLEEIQPYINNPTTLSLTRMQQQLTNKGLQSLPKEIKYLIARRLTQKCEIFVLTQLAWNENWQPRDPMFPHRLICQPKDLKLQLYNYQTAGLTWMLKVERVVAFKQRFLYSSLLQVPGLDMVCNTKKEDFYGFEMLEPSQAVYKDKDHQFSFSTRGGIFADEMGLGKTISMLALILSNPRFTDVDSNFILRLDDLNLSFVTRATLIICPSHLVAQWEKEIKAHTPLRVCLVTTSNQHGKVTYQTILDSDIVLVSQHYISTNKTYDALRKRDNGIGRGRIHPATLKDRFPLFYKFNWHRIILDEAHELLGDEIFQQEKNSYVSNFRWCVTGTPFPRKGNSLKSALTFLKVIGNQENSCVRFLLYQAVKRSLFLRNTKDSVQREINMPPVVECLTFISLSPIERVLYDAAVFDDQPSILRQLLADPTKRFAVDDPKLCQGQISFCKREITTHRTEIKKLRKKIEKQESLLLLANQNTKSIRSRIGVLNRNIVKEETKIVRNVCKIACYASYLSEYSSLSLSECGSCAEMVSVRFITKCKCSLCSTCVAAMFDDEIDTCFCCPEIIRFEEICVEGKWEVSPPVAPQLGTGEDDDNIWFATLRQSYGSKFAATARYLYSIMNGEERVKLIVFSQFESALLKIATVLEELDPEVFGDQIVMCKGNVHARKKQLSRFNSTDERSARILLLSLNNSASGTHLAAATHVLLLDSVSGSATEAQSTDAQAIARAHRLGQHSTVTAVRFIVKKSIDQTDYENTYGISTINNPLGPKSARK